MVDFLLTRADRPLSPQEWPVWPRAGPSTLVWIFEGKKKNFFLLMDHPQTRAEGVLSPGNWPVCQPDTARGPTSREHLCKKNAASVGLVRARMRPYTGQRRGSTWNREKLCVAAQPDFSWTWCRPPRGPRVRKTAGVYHIVGRRGAQLKFFQGGLGHQPQEKGGGSLAEKRVVSDQFFLQVSLVPDMFGTPDVETECPCDHFLQRGTHLNKISLKL